MSSVFSTSVLMYLVHRCTSRVLFDKSGEKEKLVELNEANHVEGHLAEFNSEAYLKYCSTQRDRFRFLEAPLTESCQKVAASVSGVRTASRAKRWTLRRRSFTLTRQLLGQAMMENGETNGETTSSPVGSCTLLAGGKRHPPDPRHQKLGFLAAGCGWRALQGAAADFQAQAERCWVPCFEECLPLTDQTGKDVDVTWPSAKNKRQHMSYVWWMCWASPVAFLVERAVFTTCPRSDRCLMIAGPGTGKTWSSCQLMYHLSKACAQTTVTTGIVKMPALIFAQKLAGQPTGIFMNFQPGVYIVVTIVAELSEYLCRHDAQRWS